MAALLDKFRVDYKDLIAITDLHKAPEDSTRAWFDGLVRPFILRNELTGTWLELICFQQKKPN